MTKVNSIAFTTDKYFVAKYEANAEEKKIQMMWQDISNFLSILTKQGYACKVYDDDTNIIVIEYEYSNPEFGGPYLEWLDGDELDLVENYRLSTNNYQDNSKESEE